MGLLTFPMPSQLTDQVEESDEAVVSRFLGETPEPVKPKRRDPVVMAKLFENTETWDRVLPADAMAKINQRVAMASDPDADKRRMALTMFFADQFGKTPQEVGKVYGSYRDAWVRKRLNSTDQWDDAELYGTVGTWLKKQNNERALVAEMQNGLFNAFRKGDQFDKAFTIEEAVAMSNEAWDSNKTGFYREVSQRAWKMFAEKQATLEGPIQAIQGYFREAKARTTHLAPEVSEARQMATASLAGLSKEDAQLAIQLAAGAMGKEKDGLDNIDREANATFGAKIGGTVSRAFGSMYEAANVGLAMRTGAKTAQRDHELAMQMDKALMGEVDPIAGNSWFSQMWLDASQSLPTMLAVSSVVGIGVSAAAWDGEIYVDLKDRGVPDEQARNISAVAAPVAAALDIISVRMVVTGKVPLMQPIRSAAGLTAGSLARRTALVGGVELAEQYAMEVGQDLLAPAGQQWASMMNRAVPGPDWSEEAERIGASSPRTLAALAPLVLIGTANATFQDRAYGRAYVGNQIHLEALGFSKEEIEKIQNATSLEQQQAIMQAAWSQRQPSPVQRAAVEQMDAQAEANGASVGSSVNPTEAPTPTTVTRNPDGSLIVNDQLGNPVGTARTPEAAAQMIDRVTGKTPAPVATAAPVVETPSSPEQDGTPLPEPNTPPVGDPNVIALNKAHITQLRKDMGIEALPKPERERFQQVLEQAQAEGLHNNAELWAEGVIRNPRALTAKEHAALIQRAAELQNAYESTLNEAARLMEQGDVNGGNAKRIEADRLLETLDTVTQAADLSGTEAGRVLSIRRMRMKRDTYTLAKIVQRAQVANQGKLTPEQVAHFKDLADKLAVQEAKITELEKSLAAKTAEAMKAQAGTFVAEGRARRHVARAKDAAARRQGYKRELEKLGYRLNDVTNVIGLSAEVASLLAKIAETHIEEGATNLADVVAKVRAELPDVSEQDIYNSLGRRTQKAVKSIETEAKRRVKELRTQARLVAQINDALANVFDPKKPKARDSAEVKALRAKLAELRLQVDRTATDDAQLKRLHEKINEVQAQLEGGFRAIKEQADETRPDVAKARETLAELRREMALVDSIATLEEQIRTGEAAPKAERSEAESARIEALKAQRDGLRKQIQGEEAITARRERLAQRIMDLESQLAGGFRTIPEKKARGEDPADIQTAQQKVAELERLMRTQDAIADLEAQLNGTVPFRVSEAEERVIESAELEKALIKRKQLQREVNAAIAAMQKKNLVGKAREGLELLRSLKATADLSAVFRQGLFMVARRPTALTRAFVEALRAAINQDTADAIELAIENSPNHVDRMKAGLELSSLDVRPSAREEYFMSQLAERIPGIGRVVKASNRHMTTFLNLMRVAAYDQFTEAYPSATKEQKRAWAEWVNINSGKGQLGKFKQAAGNLAFVFFSPRYFISRFQVVYSPFKNIKDPIVRKEIAKDIGSVAALGMTAMFLAKMAGAEVGDDPTEPDFGKIIVGNTRYDLFAGMLQTMRLISLPAIAAGQRVGLYELERDIDLIDSGRRFLSYKLSPTITVPTELISGRDVLGREKEIDESLLAAVTPLTVDAAFELYNEDNTKAEATIAVMLSALGVGVQEYEDN